MSGLDTTPDLLLSIVLLRYLGLAVHKLKPYEKLFGNMSLVLTELGSKQWIFFQICEVGGLAIIHKRT
jgi:hypothetical protein